MRLFDRFWHFILCFSTCVLVVVCQMYCNFCNFCRETFYFLCSFVLWRKFAAIQHVIVWQIWCQLATYRLWHQHMPFPAKQQFISNYRRWHHITPAIHYITSNMQPTMTHQSISGKSIFHIILPERTWLNPLWIVLTAHFTTNFCFCLFVSLWTPITNSRTYDFFF